MLMKNIKTNIKLIVIISICIILTLASLLSLELISFYSFNCARITKKDIYFFFSRYKDQDQNEAKYIFDTNKVKYRKVQNENSKLKPILLFGGIYAYGSNLNKNETLSYYLSDITNRPVYNRAKADTNANHMYYQLSNNDFYKIVPKPEYIFYLYVPYQIVTAKYKFIFCQQDIFHKINQGKLYIYNHIPLYKKSYFLTKINQCIFEKNYLNNIFYLLNEKLFLKLLTESKKEAQNHWGDVKFVIIRYYRTTNRIEDRIFKTLEKEGFIIFDLYKYVNTANARYSIKPRYYPDNQFWQNASCIIANYLKL